MLLQAMACNAAEVDWCPFGKFTADLAPPQPDPGSKAKHHRLGNSPSVQPQAGLSSNSNKQQQPLLHADVKLAGGGTSVPLPADLAGKSAYGSSSYYLSHQWACSWAELVGMVLQHYMRLPEVQRYGGTKFVPIYYWVSGRWITFSAVIGAAESSEGGLSNCKDHPHSTCNCTVLIPQVDVFAVPQASSQQSSEFKHHRADVLSTVASSCQAVLLLLGAFVVC